MANQTETFNCPHCKGKIQIEEVLFNKFKARNEKKLSDAIKAEADAKVSVLEDKLAAMELEKKTDEVISNEAIDSKINLALAKQKNEIVAENSLNFQALQNENISLKRNINTLKKSAEQGSVQRQGEVGEVLIENMLMAEFPTDEVEEIKKGARGADCILWTKIGMFKGSVMIESKVTKSFSTAWVEKLKDDMKRRDIDFGVIVTDVMPADRPSAHFIGNVWVCGFHEFLHIVSALRQGLHNVNRIRVSQEVSDEKAREMFNYLTSSQFATTIEKMLRPINNMREQLESEKRALTKHWRLRQKNIDNIFDAAAIFHGELVAIAGNSLPEIPCLPDMLKLEMDNE